MDTDLRNTGGSNLPGDDEEVALRLLERLVTGEGSPADEAALAAWIGENPKRQRMIDRLRARWGAVPEAHDADAGWARMARHLRPATPEAQPDRGPAMHPGTRQFSVALAPRRSRVRTAVAAGMAAAVAAVAFWLGQLPGRTSEPIAPAVYATTIGQRTDVRLADGTRVLIAPESRVRLAADYGAQRRDVYVEGEAYFEVVHDSTRPFTVFAANTSTRDIGTAFTVRSYAEERAVRVVVTEGEVVMSGAGSLTAGDVGRLTAEGDVSVRRGVNVDALVSWTRGELMFEDAPLGQVLQDLRRWYGVEVRVADSALATLPFTGSLHDATPAQGVALVAATLGLGVTRDGAHTVLHKR